MDRAEVYGRLQRSEHEVRARALDDIFARFAEGWAHDEPEPGEAQEPEPPFLAPGGVVEVCQGIAPR